MTRSREHRGVVFATLKFVAHHGHLGVSSGFLIRMFTMALGFSPKGPLEVFVAGGDGLEKVGAVVIGGAHSGARGRSIPSDVAVMRERMKFMCSSRCAHAGRAVSLSKREPTR